MSATDSPVAKQGPLLKGKPSRKAAAVAIAVHAEVTRGGEPLRLALSKALEGAEKLGGNERRFVGFAARELSRHHRWLDAAMVQVGAPASSFSHKEDAAIVRYALWRRLRTGATSPVVMAEVRTPGPTRPRSISDASVERILAAPLTVVDGPRQSVDELARIHSYPKWLAERLCAQWPVEEWDRVLAAFNAEPRLAFRVRSGIDVDALVQGLNGQGVPVERLGHDGALLTADDGRSIFETKEFKKRSLQVMDVGSQSLAALCQVRPGHTVIDYCAGAGGKTLALAEAVGLKGRVFAHDTSVRRLRDGRTRVAEWGLRNVAYGEPLPFESADVVLVDAPCSGSGGLMKEPDLKWTLTAAQVERFAQMQFELLCEVAPQVRVGAVVVYGTCSVFAEENEAVVKRFLAHMKGFAQDGPLLRVWPHREPSGGFFGARLTRVG